MRLPRSFLRRFAIVALLAVAVVGCKKKKKEETIDPAPAAAEPQAPQPGGAVAGPLAIDGLWRITSAANPSGKAYTGNVQISRAGEAWDMSWKLHDGSTQSGIGIDLGNGVLAAGWGGTEAFGVVVYDVAGGTLTGKWAQKGLRTLGLENLSGPPGLNGNYTVTLGKGPTGAAYTGSLRISPNGNLYDLTWTTDGTTQKGVGLLEGSKLIAGWGIANGAGFVRYKSSASRLDGVWAPVGGNRTAVEVLER